MTAKTLCIKNAARYPRQEDYDVIELTEGVNIIVGEMNAGKTKWLQMFDYVLGDPGSAEDAFDKELADKYERIALTLKIGSEEYEVERRWKETGAKSKIFVNKEGMSAKHFSEFILGKLDIPLIQVPSGSPYGDRAWPELSWRELLRHMYKQERFWSDFAQKQSEVVRSACILHFLDAAKRIYSEQFTRFVAKQKEKSKLEAQKAVFVGVLQDFAVDLIGQPEMTVSITPDSVSVTRKRLHNRLTEIEKQRISLLESSDRQKSISVPGYEDAKQRLESFHQELGRLDNEKNQNVRRRAELVEYAKTLESELARFARAKTGASVLADLTVTHCPACDQEIPDHRYSHDNCQVCGQKYLSADENEAAGRRRIEFEEQQVAEELDELRKLIAELLEQACALDVRITDLQQMIHADQRAIAAATLLAVRAIPPELALFDQEIGQISAQLSQLDRIERSLASREEMNVRIAYLDDEITALDSEIKRITPNVDYQKLSDVLADRMNDYLNALNADSLSRWKTGRVSVKLRKDSFDLLLDNQSWAVKAGGTANYIIQLAYHFALFSLTKDDRYNYPGFLIIDFPPHFAKADDLRDSETYLLEPFVKLCALERMSGAQVIVAGRAFDNLPEANVIRL